jgi:SAF domain
MTTVSPGTPVPAPSVLPRGSGSVQTPIRSTGVPPPPVVRTAAVPRQWKPRQVLLAVLVVALGGLTTMWAVGSYAHRDRVLVMAQSVAVGHRISVDDLAGADLTLDPRVAAFTVAQQGDVIGEVALVDLAKGTLVNASQVGSSPLLTAGQVLVPLQLKPGQMPSVGVTPGQQVLLVATPVDTSQSAGAGAPADPIEATVAESGEPDAATAVTVVDVRVSQDVGVSLARMAASGNVTVVVLPPGAAR